MMKTTIRLRFIILTAALLFSMSVPLSASAQSLPGDANDDGQVTIADVVTLIDYLLIGDGSSINLENSDLDGDRIVSISDITFLIDYLIYGPPEENVPQTETFTVEGVSFTMVFVQGGTYIMGSGTNSDDTPHWVTLSDFSIGQTEVTQELWLAVMGYNPSWFCSNEGYEDNLQRPVEEVNWYMCQDFIAKLNRLTGRTFRLPTEAEWEFAAKGGIRSRDYLFSGSNDIDEVGWYGLNLPLECGWSTQSVGMKKPNELGIYDMTGNVFELCQDWFGKYPDYPQTNPTGPSEDEIGAGKVVRGGSWYETSPEKLYTTSHMFSIYLYGISTNVGLRLVISNQ